MGREQKEDEKDTAAAIEVLRIRIKVSASIGVVSYIYLTLNFQEWKAEHVLREKDLALLTRNFEENQALRKQELAMIETLTGIIKVQFLAWMLRSWPRADYFFSSATW